MNPTLVNAAAMAARLLLALIFIQSGLGKITGFEGTAAAIAAKGVPLATFAAALTIAVEVGGGLLLVAGWKARWAAMALFLFIIAVTYVFHNPAGLPADLAQAQTIQLMKNFAIMGGMLMVVAFGPGGWSIDGRTEKEAR